MKHLRKPRKFSRESAQRSALMRDLASAFFLFGKITTTEAKAKELRPRVEKFITKAKEMSLSSQRLLRSQFSAKLVKKILEVGKKQADRKGGYTRITKLGQRKSDSAKMAVIELVK